LNILIVTQYFFPENFRINDFAEEFKNRGHKITVLTGVPNYPNGKFYNGYGIIKKNIENYNGIKIYRAPLISRGSGNSIRLAINYFSYVIGSLITSLFLLKYKFDIIFVFEPSPITVGIPAIFIKKIKKIPICFWVLDLWPESVISAGNLKSSVIPKLLNPLVKYIYNNSDKILVSSNGFIKSIVQKGIAKNKINFFPQWAEKFFQPIKTKKYLLNSIPKDSFKIMFAGNIGEAQDFKSIIETANILKKNDRIHWIILGGGRKEQWVKSQIKKNKLEKCFHMFGSYPIEKMPEFYSQSDCLLFSLKKEYIFSITIPAKVQSYLACAKPIVAMIDGEAAKIIDGANAGLTCPSESPDLLAKNIQKLSLMQKHDLNKLGDNAINLYNRDFERNMLMDRIEKLFYEMINRSELESY
tara:strand:- start:10446 stop:11684 length:1239 start_codon:yes stop_codon:yes gene_type:complete